jgi:SAM-dependent methyltransferase
MPDLVQLAADETERFLLPYLDAAPQRLLEVGCGRGHLAERLRARGHEVTAIDLSPAMIDESRRRGVDARLADFLDFADGTYDRVLFTRSLHHIADLGAAVRRAQDLTRLSGLLIAEEFAVETADAATAGWFYDVNALLGCAGLLKPGNHHDAGQKPLDPLGRWRHDHRHEPPLHEGAAMLAAIGVRFEVLQAEAAPYLYRPFLERLEPTEQGLRVAKELLKLEKEGIAQGRLRALGLRIVALVTEP